MINIGVVLQACHVGYDNCDYLQTGLKVWILLDSRVNVPKRLVDQISAYF